MLSTKIDIENALFERATQIYAEAAQKSCDEIVRDTAARLARRLLRATPPLARGNKRKDHTNFLRQRILEMRMPRGRLTTRKLSRPMHEATARRFFAVAKARQGEMIAGWNALAKLGNIKPATWISRHGNNHGTAAAKTSSTGTTAKITFEEHNAKTRTREDIGKILIREQSEVARGLAGNAAHILKKRIVNSEQ